VVFLNRIEAKWADSDPLEYQASLIALIPVLFAPGLDGLSREATHEEVTLWERLSKPANVTKLLGDGHELQTVEEMLLVGGIIFVADHSSEVL
jgi:hypothetical protein